VDKKNPNNVTAVMLIFIAIAKAQSRTVTLFAVVKGAAC